MSTIDVFLSTTEEERIEHAEHCAEAYGSRSCRGCCLDGYCPRFKDDESLEVRDASPDYKSFIIKKYVDLALELVICNEKGWQVQGMIVSAQKRLLCELEPRLANIDVEVMGVAVGDFHNWSYLVLAHQQISQHSYAKVARVLRTRLGVELACSCGEGVKR